MSNDQAKGRKVPGFYLTRVGRIVLACILVAVAIWPMGIQPQATQAAPVHTPQTPTPPTPPTPTPIPPPPSLTGEGAADQAPHTPPSSGNLPPEVDQARARQAMEAVLAKYLRYWGPRYQVAPVEVAVEGEWAYGVAQWQSEAKTVSGPIHILAHRSADGTWQALLPGSDGLYRQWVDAVPESLVPAGEKSQLRTQAAEADALRQPQATSAVPLAATAIPPGREGPVEPVEPVPGLIQPTATPTPVRGPAQPPATPVVPPVIASTLPSKMDTTSTSNLANPTPTPTLVPQRVGEVEPMDMEVSYLNEASWTQTIHYPGAAYIKVHLLKLDLLPGDYVTVSDPSGTEVYTYPGSDYTTDGGEGFWAISITGDMAVIELCSGEEDGPSARSEYYEKALAGAALQELGVVIDKYAWGYSPEKILEIIEGPESTCGTNQRTDVVCYQASHPTEYGRSSAVAIHLLNGVFWCTSWRVGSSNHMFTNEHCITSQAQLDASEFWFNYQRLACGSGDTATPTKVTGNTLLTDDHLLDFALFTVNDFSSISNFGYLELDVRVPVLDEEIYIPQHGAGNPKEFGIESDMNTGNVCRIDDAITNGRGANTDTGYYCDTIGGSSGSPVLARSSHKVVALHHFGGCLNQGVRIDQIWPLVQSYLGSGTCSAPPLNSPNDGYVHTSLDRTITFNWSPPSNCIPDGYTFRVKTVPDMDSGGTTIFDEGQGGTQVTKQFGSGWDNFDLYWSVRACKPCTPYNPGPWAPVRRFRIEPPPSNDWHVEYYSDNHLGSKCYDTYQTSTYVFGDWRGDAPAGGCPSDNFSARFSRSIYFPGGDYTFGLGYDDGARIKVDGQTVVDGWAPSAQHYESRYLSSGYHNVEVEYYESAGDAYLTAFWWGPGFDLPRQSQDSSQWYAQYWGNRALWWDSVVRVNEGHGFLNHQWDLGGPGYNLPEDRFSSRFERTLHFPCGRWRFNVFSDDGVRFWIDGNLILDEWRDQAASFSPEVDLGDGDHQLRLEHYENGGSAAIELGWEQLSVCDTAPPTGRITSPTDDAVISACPLTIEAEASDEGSGVDFVEFHAYYDDNWHHLGDDHTAPYSWSWDCSSVSDQGVWLTIHVWDNAGNETMDPGGYVYITLDRSPSPQPDLVPAQWAGWQYPIVPSSIPGTTVVNTLYAGYPTYIDWGLANHGTTNTGGNTYGDLYIDSTLLAHYDFGDVLADQSWAFFDWTETVNTPGWHTLKVLVDPDDLIDELVESNNVWEHQFYWTPTAPYADDMESGANDWTATGLWHQIDEYTNPYAESHSWSHSWWYGQDSTGDYDTGSANSGDLTSPSIYIPTSGYYLRFWYRYETETQGPDWDQRWLQISVDGGPFNNVLQLFDDPMNWWLQSPAINLSGYAGHTIQIRFHFDTIDAGFNTYRGWYIDDLDISSTPPPSCADSHEPNDIPAQATVIAYGQTLSADICPGGDYDFYTFTGTAGDRVVVDIDAKVNGSLLDSYVFLLDSDGTRVLAEHDDEVLGEVQDSHLGYQLPHDGTYYIKVRAWNHPSVGGTDYFYTIRLLTDHTNPSSAEITSPGNDAWLDFSLETITASANDDESGTSHVDFLWHDADWENSDWVWLGIDWDGRDGWSWDFDTSGLAEQRGGAFYIWAFDWAGNWTGAGTWNLGIDRTPPTASADVSPMYGDAPFLDFYVWWWGWDNLSDIASYDVQYRDGAGGDWTDLLTDTTDTYYRFVGQDGHTYYFRTRARDYAGNMGTYASGDGDVEHTVQICPTSADTYEPDNSYTVAETITTDGSWQSHNFHALGDEDWVTFTATVGIIYTLVTTNTGGHADTVLYLYESDGNTLIDSNDDDPDNWPASRLEWGATRGGTYYVQVEHWDPYAYGCTTVYGLSIAETGYFEPPTSPVFLPIILRNAQ
jgi:hypothetical protein